ncbi:MAG: hypothetical protein JWN03_1001 [Nocardia sp.]|uniref:nucleotidyltransferase family protein n=1 Tax=Nocardia sp. TaxID=1821 RepID=UPI002615F478|nr:nucleotidyltransferase family protein [Nocardia sp.]MCU1640726.1 hypothetical protein [Nocardia sp.]
MQDVIQEKEQAAVLALGLVLPGCDLATSNAALAVLGPEKSAELLIRHKVSRIARARLAGLGADPVAAATAQLLADYIEPIDIRFLGSGELLDLVARVAAEGGFGVRRMKGFSQRDRYPQGLIRDVGDIDLLVADYDAAWLLAEAFLDRGYIYPPHELPWFKGDLTGGLYGQVRLISPGRVELPIDIHVGPYSVRHCGLMPMRTDLTAHIGGEPLPPVDPIDDFCCVIGNAAGDCFIDAKTVNDIVLALRAHPDPEALRAAVHPTLDAAALLPFFATCLDRVHALCAPDPALSAALDLLRPDVEPEPQPPLAAPNADHRIEVTIAHAGFAAERVPGSSPALTAAIVEGARRAYSSPSPLLVTELPYDDSRRALPQLVRWNCVRLVPLTSTPAFAAHAFRLAGRTVVLATPEGQLVDAGAAGQFVPTVDFVLPSGLVGTP